MKKAVLFITAAMLIATLSGCVNKAFLASSTAYQSSTKPYLEMILESDKISAGEKESLKLNIEEYEKTLQKYNEDISWYEF